jgi:hypothetical protein
LHFIGGKDEKLASRLASDLRPGGMLVATLPIESVGNSVRIHLRRIWRALPASADQLAFALGRRIYPHFTPEALADRLPYLRAVPVRLVGPYLLEIFAAEGLELVSDLPWYSSSVAKLEHHLFTWRRR